ncbi:MAG: type I secretion system permease/ATPase [Arcobacteraceae bacterium]|nr:type I secretion system permease/ATPase [Arcobacteraceae bacterium]
MFKQKYNPRSVLEALVTFTKLHGKPFSAEVLTEGLPMAPNEVVPQLFSTKGTARSLFSRAAGRAGFQTRIVFMGLDDISRLVLPCILLLKTESGEVNACILESFDELRENAHIIIPEIGDMVNTVSIEDLKKEYYGTAFFLKKEFRFDSADFKLIDNKKHHWFKDTIKNTTYIYKDVLLASLIINLFMMATPLFTMNVYDRVIPTGAFETLWIFAIGVIFIYIVDLGLRFTRTYLLEVAGKKADIIMSSIIFEKVLDLKLEVIPKPVGSLANVLKEFDSIRGFLTSSTIAMVIDLPFVVIFLAVMYYIGGLLVFVTIACILVILLYTFSVKDSMYEAVKETFQAGAMKNGVLIESLTTIETLKSLNALSYAQYKWEEATGEIASKSVKTKTMSTAISTVTGFVTQLNTVLLVIVGAYMIDDKSLSLGALIALVILSSRAIAPMGQVAGLISYYQHVHSAYDSIDNIMQLETEHPADKQYVRRPEFRGEIEFKNLTFSYPNSGVKQLLDVNIKIKPKEKVAILGKVGSGKTTLQKLILGFYYAQEGSLLLDGIDVKQIDPVELRSNISYMSQDVVLFSGTARSNITYKRQNATDDEIVAAAKAGGVLNFANKHPLGLEMPIGENGENLSGGQAQAVSLARTLLDDSAIVILDEPTKSFDITTERQVQHELKKYLEDKTAIIVTHKISDLILADRIIVMDDGKVILDGKKDDVLKQLSGKKS